VGGANSRKRGFSKKFKVVSVILLGVGLVFVAAIFPALNKAHAGVFSFISNVLAAKETNNNPTDAGKYNSQNISLLEAPLAPKLAVGGPDISIVDESLLAYEAESTGEARPSDQISAYVVHEGDTLSQIADMFNVSVNTIVWANDIKGGVINPGDTLIILPVTGVKHIVKNGDTIDSIAKKYKGDVDEILSFNNIEGSSGVKLKIGMEIIIPNAEVAEVVTSSGKKVVSAGYFIRPLTEGRKTQGIHGHNGIDIGVPEGTKIYASAAGKIIVSKNSGYNGGYGSYIVISHPNGTQTVYAHLSKTAVAAGTEVVQGQLIGYSGNTGRSTGAHLHFEIRGAKNPF
jgi:LysM repeat protein